MEGKWSYRGGGVGIDGGIDVGCGRQRNLANDARCGGVDDVEIFIRRWRHYLAADVMSTIVTIVSRSGAAADVMVKNENNIRSMEHGSV
jgi:hypothetical protein